MSNINIKDKRWNDEWKKKVFTPERNKKISDSLKKIGHKPPRQEKVWNKGLKGIHLSPQSEFKKGNSGFWTGKKRHNISGEKHFNWKGGKKKCIDCGQKLASYSIKVVRCKKCAGKLRTKEKNHNWKGGISTERDKIRSSIESRLWKKAIFERDNWICQKYGTKISGTLCAHHINNFSEFPELRFAIDNGITLSEKAHKEFHKKYGYHNNTKEQLLEFISVYGSRN